MQPKGRRQNAASTKTPIPRDTSRLPTLSYDAVIAQIKKAAAQSKQVKQDETNELAWDFEATFKLQEISDLEGIPHTDTEEGRNKVSDVIASLVWDAVDYRFV